MPSQNATPELILASQSRYRKELLERLALPFGCAKPAMDEDTLKESLLAQSKTPRQVAEALAKAKAESLRKTYPQAWILGSDQLLDFEGEILGKAPNHSSAVKQLSKLSGRSHDLVTAWTLVGPAETRRGLHVSRITLRKLSAEEIDRYVRHEKPFDCAGSYKMESLGISLVEKIESSDFSSIIGLPLIELSRHLREIGFNVP